MRITLSRPWLDPDGKLHRSDSTLTLPEPTARELVFKGLARIATTDAATLKEGAKND